MIVNRGVLVNGSVMLNHVKNEDNHYRIINKIYNDIQFKAMCYNIRSKFLFLSDFGSYIIRLTFNSDYGDI